MAQRTIPNPDDLANAFLLRESQPVALGPEAVVTPEHQGLVQADIAAQGGIPGGAITIPQQPAATLESAKLKQRTGQPMNQAELDLFTQGMREGEGAEALIPESAKRILGKSAQVATSLTRQIVIPTATTAAGGAVGSFLLGPGPGTLAGATAGSALGTEINFALGLEKESDISRTLALLAPGVGAGAARVTKSLLGATPAAQALRSGFASEIAERAPKMVFNAPGQKAVTESFDALRASGGTLNIKDFGRALDDLKGLDTDFAKKIIGQIEKVGPEAKAAIAKLSPRGPLLTEVAIDPNRFVTDIGDIAEIRKAIKTAKNSAFERKGVGKPAAKRQAAEFQNLSKALDNIIDTAADAGDPAAVALKEANLLSRIQRSQEELGQLFNTARSSETFGGREVQKFDISKIDTQFNQAREALRNDRPHKFADLVKTMDEVGETKGFTEALTQLRRLSPKENPLLFGESFGIITRAAQVLGKTAGVNFLGEAMLNPVARGVLLRLVGATKGRITIPILATAVAAGRAATGEELDEGSRFILDKLASTKQLATEEELRAATTQEVTTPEFTIAGSKRALPSSEFVQQDIRPVPPPPSGLIQRFGRALEPAGTPQ